MRENSEKARIQNNSFLNKYNKVIYTPTDDYNPSTKKYVDDNFKKYSDLQFPIAAGKVPSANTPNFEIFTANT